MCSTVVVSTWVLGLTPASGWSLSFHVMSAWVLSDFLPPFKDMQLLGLSSPYTLVRLLPTVILKWSSRLSRRRWMNSWYLKLWSLFWCHICISLMCCFVSGYLGRLSNIFVCLSQIFCLFLLFDPLCFKFECPGLIIHHWWLVNTVDYLAAIFSRQRVHELFYLYINSVK